MVCKERLGSHFALLPKLDYILLSVISYIQLTLDISELNSQILIPVYPASTVHEIILRYLLRIE